MARESNRFKEEIKLKLCEKYNLPMYKINAICDFPEQYLRKVIEKGELETVMFPYFGKFYVKEKLKQMINSGLVVISERKDGEVKRGIRRLAESNS